MKCAEPDEKHPQAVPTDRAKLQAGHGTRVLGSRLRSGYQPALLSLRLSARKVTASEAKGQGESGLLSTLIYKVRNDFSNGTGFYQSVI